MQADAEIEAMLAGCLGPTFEDVLLRPHVHRVPRLILAVPQVEVVVMVTQGEKVLGTYLLIESHQLVGVPLLGLEQGMISLKPTSDG